MNKTLMPPLSPKNFSFLFLLLLASLFSACASSPNSESTTTPKQVLKINAHSEPVSSDPRKSSDITTAMLMRMLYDGLMRYTPSGDLTPSIADSYTISEDQLHYVFKLKNATWSDGSPLTAYDFERSWKKTLDPYFPSSSVDLMYPLKNAQAVKIGSLAPEKLGVKAKDEQTLEVELEHPTPYFLQLLTLPTFFPTHPSLEEEDFDLLAFKGNGPFLLQEWQSKDRIFLKKNPYYWDRESVKLEEISISLVEDEHTELNLFENQELNWAGSPISTVPTDALSDLKEKNLLQSKPLSSTYWYKFNTQAFPFHNKNIRKAFSAAINRGQIIEHITQGNQTPALSIVPPIYQLQTPHPFQDGDVKQARAYLQKGLQELGITKDELHISLAYSTGERHQKITQAIQEQWKKAFDIEVELKNYEWPILLQKLSKHDFQIAGRGWVAEFSDPLYFLQPYAQRNSDQGGHNDTQWHQPAYTALLNEAKTCTDSEQRKALLRQAEEIFLEDMPVIPFFHSTLVYLKDPQLQDVCLSELSNFDFKWAYFTQIHL